MIGQASTEACVCTQVLGDPDFVSFDCSNRGLTAIPACVPNDVQRLYVEICSALYIYFVLGHNFHLINCSQVGYNPIQELDDFAFARFYQLESLYVHLWKCLRCQISPLART